MFELRGPKAKPEALVDGWPVAYWEDYQHPTHRRMTETILLDVPCRRSMLRARL